jgi:hypothetical protein
LDFVVISNTRHSPAALKKYEALNQFPVWASNLDAIRKITKAKIILADLADEHDLIRHDSEKTRNVIQEIIKQTHLSPARTRR